MRREKQYLLDEIKQKIDDAKAMIVMRYEKLPPNLSWDFRDQLNKAGSCLEIVRKRVFVKALKQAGIKVNEATLTGHVGVVFITEVDVAPSAKLIYQFSESNQNILQVIYGQVDGKEMSGSDIEMLSKLPSIQEMRSQFIGYLVSPMAQMLSVLEAVAKEPLSVLEQKS